MDVSKKIKSMEREIETRRAIIAFLLENREFLESFSGTVLESCGTLYFTKLGVEKINRDEVMAILKQFPGKWLKTYDQDKVSYERERTEGDVIGLSIYESEAPASCRIEETEVEVPARKVIQRRLVCSEVA